MVIYMQTVLFGETCLGWLSDCGLEATLGFREARLRSTDRSSSLGTLRSGESRMEAYLEKLFF